MSQLQSLLERRFAQRLGSWPATVVEDVVGYLGEPGDHVDGNTSAERFWSLLPRWLLHDRRFIGSRRRGWLNDILWAQYCLFLFVRIHDDLFDGHTESRSLVFVADELLLECETTLAKYQLDVSFWRIFRRNVSRTVHAILHVDALQRRPGAMCASTLGLHADVSSIFKVGSAAVCVDSQRMREFRHISRCADELAIAEQLLDDLFDIEQDLARGRYTFAANQLLADDVAPGDARARLTKCLLFGGGTGAVLDRVCQHLDRASAAIGRVRLEPAARFVGTLRTRVEEFRRQFHPARVEYVFRNLKNTRDAGLVSTVHDGHHRPATGM